MKKVLLGTSAVALLGMGSVASAAEWSTSVNGYMEEKLGFADVDANSGTEYRNIDLKHDREIHFNAGITLDNGLKFAGHAELEASGSGDYIDEAYVTVSGSFGTLILGSENSAGYKMSIGAPDVSIVNVASGDQTNWMPIASGAIFRGVVGSSYLEVERNNDAERITYFSPSMGGFKLGLSYAPDGLQDNNTALVDGAQLEDIIDIAASYSKDFGSASVSVMGRYGTASNANASTDPTPKLYGGGINVGFGGFTIGGAYFEQDGGASAREGTNMSAGISYATGPWGVSLTWMQGEGEGSSRTDGLEEKLTSIQAAVNYKMGPGVSLNGTIAHNDYEDDVAAGAGDVEALYAVAGVKIAF